MKPSAHFPLTKGTLVKITVLVEDTYEDGTHVARHTVDVPMPTETDFSGDLYEWALDNLAPLTGLSRQGHPWSNIRIVASEDERLQSRSFDYPN
jgi:hypothetical protein